MTTRTLLLPLLAAPLFAAAQSPAVMRDLEPLSPATLSKADLDALLPGAKMSRIVGNGNEHIWTNDADGSFIVSTTGKASGGVPSTGRGKWHITDDGRYCIFIEWRTSSDDWCRFVVKTSDGYYMAKSTKSGTEKIYKVEVNGR